MIFLSFHLGFLKWWTKRFEKMFLFRTKRASLWILNKLLSFRASHIFFLLSLQNGPNVVSFLFCFRNAKIRLLCLIQMGSLKLSQIWKYWEYTAWLTGLTIIYFIYRIEKWTFINSFDIVSCKKSDEADCRHSVYGRVDVMRYSG